jgi:hypothetical protein
MKFHAGTATLETEKMKMITTSLVAAMLATATLSAPVRAEEQSTVEKVKTMTKVQWAKMVAEWRKDKAKYTACNTKSKADGLKGRKRWAAIYDCMKQ